LGAARGKIAEKDGEIINFLLKYFAEMKTTVTFAVPNLQGRRYL
jgi:hypothetical protein